MSHSGNRAGYGSLTEVIIQSLEPKFDILLASNGSYTLKFQLIAILFG